MRAPVIALLGPTNTGKTHLALERLLEHRSGIIGFPLRLLARENYDRLVAARGAERVALITGEERLVPQQPDYFVCTVEAMPLDRPVELVAVDEIQHAADRERGHVFTDRLLHARGTSETMFLGSDTIRPLIRELVPDAQLLTRERLSTLRYVEPKRLNHLPRRTAVVVFSVAGVYQTAEELRRLRGGAAVVFGALSPRTRNAQVGLYQAGEVDYLVATDAIGMGLNLDIDHVALTSLSKFDGQGPRRLSAAEVGQIAGRAGRHVKDGSFGGTSDLGPLPKHVIAAVESHRFAPLKQAYWRNPGLDFRSPATLLDSLEAPPPSPRLVRMKGADDHRALAALARDAELGDVRGEDAMRLLWEVCRIPDFRNVMEAGHTRLLSRIYQHLASSAGRLPEDWVAAQVSRLDRSDGDVETLLDRIAHVRTWTYVSHRSGWLADAAHWQERTRGIEDRLSDTLHERLTQQFVDHQASVLARAEPGELVASFGEDGALLIQGLRAGRLQGFRFEPDPSARSGARSLLAAANRALRAGIDAQIERLEAAPEDEIALSGEGVLSWRDAPVARLVPGDEPLAPKVQVLQTELLDTPRRKRARASLRRWLDARLEADLGPLRALGRARLPAAARGLAFALGQGLGSIKRLPVTEQVRSLQGSDRSALHRLGVRLGRESVYMPLLLTRAATRTRGLLFGVYRGQEGLPVLDASDSLRVDPRLPAGFYEACGYRVLGERALRVDALERLVTAARERAAKGPFPASEKLARQAGIPAAELPRWLECLGYPATGGGRHAWRGSPWARRSKRRIRPPCV